MSTTKPALRIATPAMPELPRYRRITFAELAAGNYELDYHVADVLPVGQPTILAAPRKGMKTSVALDMAISLATGGKWLGYFPVTKPGRVAFMSGESGEATLQETASRICRAAGRKLANLTGGFISPDLPDLQNDSDLDELERFLKHDETTVAFFDCAYLMMDGDEAGNLFKQGRLLRGLARVCQRCGVTPVLLHHMRRNGRASANGGAPSLDDLSWSGFAEFARSWILIDRIEEFDPERGLHQLDMSIGGSAGHCSRHALKIEEGHKSDDGGRRWDVTISRPQDAERDAQERKAEARQQSLRAKLEATMKRMANAAAKFPSGETAKVIREHAGVSGTLASQALAALLEDGVLVPCDVTKGNRKTPHQGYRLTSGTSGTTQRE
jgi:hypothetical protein